jgi:SnoaL-like protein
MTPREYAEAFDARDYQAVSAGLAPDVVLYSPITGRFHFEGRDEVLDLIRLVRDTLDDFEHLHTYGSDKEGTLVFRARIGRHELEGNDYLRFDSEGRIAEFRIFIRPLPGLARLAAALAPPLVRRRSRALAVLVRLSLAPLVMAIAISDAIGARLVR